MSDETSKWLIYPLSDILHGGKTSIRPGVFLSKRSGTPTAHD